MLRKYMISILLLKAVFTSLVFAQQTTDLDHKLPAIEIDDELHLSKKYLSVLGEKMAYLETGEEHQNVVVFIHGNPTSSYLWRNVIPHVSKSFRSIAIDLIGMGDSSKPEISYSFTDHYRYVSAFIEKLNVDEITLVGHDWGAAIAWEYARKNQSIVKSLTFMEGLVPPAFPIASYNAMGEEMGSMFKAFNDPIMGEKMVIQDHLFVEKILPGFVNRKLSNIAMEAYRKPYIALDARKPILAWPREVPIAGHPQHTKQTLLDISEFMSNTKMPVLLLYAKPGVLVNQQAVDYYLNKISNLETTYVGQGLHFIQEDQPDAIGLAIHDWLRRQH